LPLPLYISADGFAVWLRAVEPDRRLRRPYSGAESVAD